MAQRVYLKKSSVVDKTPAANSINFGELAINYASGTGKAFLAAKKYDGTIAKFHEDQYNASTYATKGEVTGLQSELETFATKDMLRTFSGAAVTSAYTMAVNYVNGAISGLTAGNYLTVESATSVFNKYDQDLLAIESSLGNFALSSTVKNQISAISATVEDNEYVVAMALNELNDRLESINVLSGTFLTVESANSIVTTLGNDIQAAQTKADSAYTYTNAISATVKNNYYTKSESNTQIANASARTFSSAKTYADKTFLKASSADSIVTTLSSSIQAAQDTANSAYTYADAISASVKNSYYSKADVNTQIANASARTVGSAKTYADKTFLTISSADSIVTTLGSDVQGAKAKADSAYTYADAISATVKNNYYSKTDVNTQIANASARTVGSAKTYADKTFLTIDSANSIVTTLGNDVQTALSKANSAYTYAAVTSATVKNNYYTKTDVNTQIANASARTVGSAKTYVDNNFVGNNTYTAFTSSTSSDITGLRNKDIALSGDIITLSGNIVSKLSSVYKYKGTKDNASQLPTTGNENGDVWNVVAASGNTPSGTNYAWVVDNPSTNAGHWDALGGTIDLSAYALKSTTDSLSSEIGGVRDGLTALSGQVVNNYATKSLVASMSAAAVTAAENYVNGLVEGFSYLTVDSATSIVTTLGSDIQAAQTKANSAYTYAAAISATVKNNYYTKTDTNTQIANASARTFTSAKTYADKTFLTAASANSIVTDLNNSIDGVNNRLTGFSATVMSDYATETEASSYAAAALGNAMAYTDSKISGLSIGNYLTVASATSKFNSIDSNIQAAQNAANSAYTYSNAISATVKNNYYTKTDANTQIANASARTVGSAKTYADKTFLTISSASSKFTSIDSNIQAAQTTANSAYTYANVISATVKNNYYTKTDANTQIANASARTVGSAKTYADKTFLTISSASSKFTSIDSNVQAAQSTANSAYTYANVTSATVKNNYYTKTDTNTQVGNASARTVGSAKTYADATFLKAASADSIVTALNNSIDGVNTSLTTLSSSVITNYATDAKASSYAAAALGNAMDYTDSKIGGLSIGNYLTIASATSKFTSIDSNIQAAQTTANSAYTYASVISATVKNNYYTKTDTNTQIANASARTFASAKTYGDKTFLTIASASSKFASIDSNIQQAQTAANSALTCASIISATVKNSYVTNVTLSNVSGAIITSAITASKDYVDSSFFTKASAGTMYTTLSSDISSVSGGVAAAIAEVYGVIEDNEEVTAASLNDLNTKLSRLSGMTSSVDDIYFTKASAGTMYTTLSNNINTVDGRVTSLSGSVVDKLTNVYHYKGSVTNYSNLPASNQVAGDVYNVVNANGTTPAGTNYAWNGTAWDALGGTVDLSPYMQHSTFGSYSSSTESKISTAQSTANSAYTYAAAISATVKNSYYTKTDANTQIANASARTVGSAKTYADKTFLTISSASSKFTSIDNTTNGLNTTLTKVNSSYISAVTYTTASTTTSITNNTLTIPKPRVLTITKNGEAYKTYDGTAAVTADTVDSAVTQGNSTTASFRPLLMGATSHATAASTAFTATTKNQVYLNKEVGVQPSTGIIYAKGFLITGKTKNDLVTASGTTIPSSNFANSAITHNEITAATANATKTLTITQNGTSVATYNGTAATTAATTDKMVQQENVTTANYRPILLGSNNNAALASVPTTTVTATTYTNNNIYAQPSTGELGAGQMKVGGHVTLQYNSTTQSLDFIFS